MQWSRSGQTKLERRGLGVIAQGVGSACCFEPISAKKVHKWYSNEKALCRLSSLHRMRKRVQFPALLKFVYQSASSAASSHKWLVFVPQHFHLSLTDKASLRRERSSTKLCASWSVVHFVNFTQRGFSFCGWFSTRRKGNLLAFFHSCLPGTRGTWKGFTVVGYSGTRFQSGKLTNLITHLWAPSWTRARNGSVYKRWWPNDSTLSTNCTNSLSLTWLWPPQPLVETSERDIMNNSERARNAQAGWIYLSRKFIRKWLLATSSSVHTGWWPT